MGLDEPLADGQAEAAAETAGRVIADGVFLEQVRELLRRNAPARVGDRNRHVGAVAPGGDSDGRRLGGVAGRVREQVVQDLDDALPVGHHAGQVRGQVGGDRVPAAAAQEARPRRVHQHRDVRGFERDRQRARRDAPRVQQVPDQTAHPGRLLVDDAEELHHFGPGESRLGGEHRTRRALDRGERRAQLVTHDREELRAHSLELLERRQILHRDYDRLDFAVRRMNRRRVDQRPHAPAIGHGELDLLGANRFGAAQLPLQREVRQGDLASVGPPARDEFGQLLDRAVRDPQAFDDPFRLAVQRHDTPGPGVQDHHADRRGGDQGLHPVPRPPFVPEGARVGDRRPRVRSEQREHVLVSVGEIPTALLVGDEEVADAQGAAIDRLAQRGAVGQHARAEPVAPEMFGRVLEPQRAGKPRQMLEQPRPVGPVL